MHSIQFLGTWYEVERSFYLPELASGCTTLTFQEEVLKQRENGMTSVEIDRIEVAVKSINQWCVFSLFTEALLIPIHLPLFSINGLFWILWAIGVNIRTGGASVSIGYVYPETKNSSIMDIKVSIKWMHISAASG